MGRYREVETEQQAKSFEARIWWVFWGIALVVLAYTVWHQVREYDLVHNGQWIEAEYYTYNGKELAKYRDENNRYYGFDVSGRDAIHDENTIKLYYKTSISAAEPHIHPRMWIFSYVLFGTAFVLCSLKLHQIYSKQDNDFQDWGNPADTL